MRLFPSSLSRIAALTVGVMAARSVLRRRALAQSPMLIGQVALVTGASRGLGLLVARELGRQGCRLVICARSQVELDQAANLLRADGAEVLAKVCDVTDRVQVDALVAAAEQRYGRVDVLVNNAGIITVGPVDNLTDDDFREAMETDFFGQLHPTLALLPSFRARRSGRIVNVTSIGGVVAVPHLLPYSAAKFAAQGLSEGLAAELAKDGITVTTVVPGLMRTGSHVQAFFGGDGKAEFAWFSLLAGMPLLSLDAEVAARRIVSAIRLGEGVVTVGLPAALALRFHGLLPGLTTRLSKVADRLLPSPDSGGSAAVTRGEGFAREAKGSWLGAATTLNNRASRRFQFVDLDR